MQGKWIESLTVTNLKTKEDTLIWKSNPLPAESDSMYHFTNFTLQLNHLEASLCSYIPPTDSRLRPDQRALEEGDLRLAADEKIRLEDKQRKAKKLRDENGILYKPKYFEEYCDPVSGEVGYKYIGGYWE